MMITIHEYTFTLTHIHDTSTQEENMGICQ